MKSMYTGQVQSLELELRQFKAKKRVAHVSPIMSAASSEPSSKKAKKVSFNIADKVKVLSPGKPEQPSPSPVKKDSIGIPKLDKIFHFKSVSLESSAVALEAASKPKPILKKNRHPLMRTNNADKDSTPFLWSVTDKSL